MKHVLVALMVSAVGAQAAAQSVPARQDQAANAAAKVPVEQHRSAFEGYRSYKDEEAVRWREANDEVGRLGGHVGHVKKGTTTQPGSAPAKGHAGHGGQK